MLCVCNHVCLLPEITCWIVEAAIPFGEDSALFRLKHVRINHKVRHSIRLEVSRNPEVRTLTVTWTATDKNLGRTPITLSYEKSDGTWVPFARTLENTGRYIWSVPPYPEVPYQFHLRVEAVDRAGNVGEARTTEPVKVDLSKPKVQILGVNPAEGGVKP